MWFNYVTLWPCPSFIDPNNANLSVTNNPIAHSIGDRFARIKQNAKNHFHHSPRTWNWLYLNSIQVRWKKPFQGLQFDLQNKGYQCTFDQHIYHKSTLQFSGANIFTTHNIKYIHQIILCRSKMKMLHLFAIFFRSYKTRQMQEFIKLQGGRNKALQSFPNLV